MSSLFMGTSPAPTATTTLALLSYFVSEKLNNTNFFLWQQQVELVIKAHCLQRYLVNPQILSQFLSLSNSDLGIENPKYTTWENQDQLLLLWLQSSLLASFILTSLAVNTHFKFGRKSMLISPLRPKLRFVSFALNFAPYRKMKRPLTIFFSPSRHWCILFISLEIMFLIVNSLTLFSKDFWLNMSISFLHQQ